MAPEAGFTQRGAPGSAWRYRSTQGIRGGHGDNRGCRLHRRIAHREEGRHDGDRHGHDVDSVRLPVLVLVDDPQHDGALLVQINYRIKATHDERSIVYPFFLTGEEQW